MSWMNFFHDLQLTAMALLQQLADPHSQLFVIFLCIIQLDYTLNGDTIDLTYLQQLYKADGLFPTFNQAPIFTVFSQRLTEFFPCKALHFPNLT